MRTPEESIRRLIFECAEMLDSANYDGLGQLFARATVHVTGVNAPIKGSDDICDFFDGMNHRDSDGSPGTRFLTSNTIVDFSDDERSARSRSYFVCFQGSKSHLAPIAAGRYHDQFSRAAGGWDFTERRVVLDLFGQMDDHVRYNPGTSTVDAAKVIATAREAQRK